MQSAAVIHPSVLTRNSFEYYLCLSFLQTFSQSVISKCSSHSVYVLTRNSFEYYYVSHVCKHSLKV